jgi:glutathione synthase/RimK-type ligase-like ATP-grasp enzyme
VSPHSIGPVVLATCAAVAGQEPEDLQVIESLRRLGIEALHVAWDDPDFDWLTVPLTVVRSTWDYPARRTEFLTWADRLPQVLNPASVLRWNTDKHYLNDLADAGFPVIPTRFLERADAFDPPPVPFVIKPAVSCSARDTTRYDPDDVAMARAHVKRLHDEGRAVMVQPYVSAIERDGEISLIFLGGKYSHSIRRRAVLADGETPKTDDSFAGDVRLHAVRQEEQALAEQVMRKIDNPSAELLYARVDLVKGLEGQPMILEVELTEPSLFLAYADGGADRFADCIASALRGWCGAIV